MKSGLALAACGIISTFVVGGCTPTNASPAPERLQVEIVSRRPHDPGAYTQGLQLVGSRLFESSGLYRESTVREVDPETGTVVRRVDLDDRYFGEGLAVVDERLIQLTWHEGTALTYSVEDLAPMGAFTYEGEGWGLCDDGSRLVMSDGSSTLHFRDRTTFELRGSVSVTDVDGPVEMLNELECVDGQVYANVYQTSDIVRIDPSTGVVTARIDASSLLAEEGIAAAGVLNGIAYDEAADTFLITGKNWPTLFEVHFVPGG